MTEDDSGPFCQHLADPYDCQILCKCGHACHQHATFNEHGCRECECEHFIETVETMATTPDSNTHEEAKVKRITIKDVFEKALNLSKKRALTFSDALNAVLEAVTKPAPSVQCLVCGKEIGGGALCAECEFIANGGGE